LSLVPPESTQPMAGTSLPRYMWSVWLVCRFDFLELLPLVRAALAGLTYKSAAFQRSVKLRFSFK
jgi:hypothetical protein